MRLAEHELHEHGIIISPTPARIKSCPAWMQMGFECYRKLDELGFKPYPSEDNPQQILETHPHASFCALLGQIPLPKPTLEGKLQRQLVLYEQVSGLNDPMEIFEEITRHKLMKGILPLEPLYALEELDAIIAALTVYLALLHPENTISIGNQQEGYIVLPVSGLKEMYI